MIYIHYEFPDGRPIKMGSPCFEGACIADGRFPQQLVEADQGEENRNTNWRKAFKYNKFANRGLAILTTK